VIAFVSIDAFSELVCGDKVHQLGKDRSPGIHVLTPHSLMRETGTPGGKFQIDKWHFTSNTTTFYEVRTLSKINVGTAVEV